MINIKTSRLILRNFQNKDANGLLEYLSTPRSSCFVDEKIDIEQAVDYINKTNICI